MEKHYFVGEMLLTKDFISVTNKPSEPASPFKQVVWGQCQREWWKWNHACVEYLIYDWSCIEPHHVPVWNVWNCVIFQLHLLPRYWIL